MSVALESPHADRPITSPPASEAVAGIASTLHAYFETAFTLWDAATGEVVHRPAGQLLDDDAVGPLARVVAERHGPAVIAEAGPLVVLAIPVLARDHATLVATAPFVTAAWDPRYRTEASVLLATSPDACDAWCAQQTIWPMRPLMSLARAAQDKLSSDVNALRLAKEVELISENLATTYEEISLIYAVTRNLRISSTDDELGRMAIEWLGECVPAEAFAVMYLPLGDTVDKSFKTRSKGRYITSGDCPLDEDEFMQLVESLHIDASSGPHVCNERITATDDWAFPDVRQLIAVPLVEGENVFGWIAAFNHSSGHSFGTVEANLIASLGTLLGIHSGNRELYRQQSELLADIVRALVSAIDAKDPYTSGHSDRVARFAVRIALEMRCSPKFVNTIYMAGLLHDVGKIGIDDNVLRKAGRLTDTEFEHIKKHPELGYRILADLKPLSDVLPAVLHHHEQWNGRGYPLGLSRTDIPLIARILAVADAYDAMTSDRPYRNGMPDERVFEIFREGTAQHWDPEVLEAFFRAKEDIRQIRERERPQIDTFRQHLI